MDSGDLCLVSEIKSPMLYEGRYGAEKEGWQRELCMRLTCFSVCLKDGEQEESKRASSSYLYSQQEHNVLMIDKQQVPPSHLLTLTPTNTTA